MTFVVSIQFWSYFSLFTTNRVNFNNFWPSISRVNSIETHTPAEGISFRRWCSDATEARNRRWLTWRENAAGTTEPVRDGQIRPDPVFWPLPFLSDVFMSRSAGHSTFSLCVCPSARSVGPEPGDAYRQPPVVGHFSLWKLCAAPTKMTREKKGTTRITTRRGWRRYHLASREREWKWRRRRRCPTALSPTLKGVTIKIDCFFDILWCSNQILHNPDCDFESSYVNLMYMHLYTHISRENVFFFSIIILRKYIPAFVLVLRL